MQGIKHAFAIESASEAEPTPSQQAAVEAVCREVVKRGLTIPALMALEMSRPLHSVGAATMRFFEPIISSLGQWTAYQEFAAFLERRGSIDHLCRRIESLSAPEGHGRGDAGPPT